MEKKYNSNDFKNIAIKQATIADADNLGEVHAAAWKQAYVDIMPQEFLNTITTQNCSNEFLKNSNNTLMRYYIVYLLDKPVGILYISLSNAVNLKNISGEILALYILKDSCGKGYGTVTIDFAVHQLKSLSCKKIILWVLECNKKARKFYERNGFLFTGVKRVIYIGKAFTQMQYILIK